MSDINQASFGGGMNLFVDDTRLAENQYREAFNVRSRYDVLEQIRDKEELHDGPTGLKQGIYTFGDYVLMFCAGRAYFRRRDLTGWTMIDGFLMDREVARYHVEVVPLTTNEYVRKQDTTGDSNANNAVKLEDAISSILGNRSGLIVQDGINQPFFMYIADYGVVARVTQKYSEWSQDAREYVPVGTVMAWNDGILYVASQGRILRSVSGRPMDFVVNIDKDGDKGGDAFTTSYTVGGGNITAIRPMANPGSTGALFVSTDAGTSYAVGVDMTNKIFGEPTFTRRYLFNASCVNNHSFIDILGDSAFIEAEGLRSFNSVLQLQNEGRNSIFSLNVASIFRGLIQSDGCAIVFDNYALFSVNTIYGYVVLVYDTLTKAFVSIDTVMDGEQIKQFAAISTDVVELYAITETKVYKLYSEAKGFATSTVRLRSWCSQNPKMELKVNSVRTVLSGFYLNSTVALSLFVNNRLSIPVMTKNFAYTAPAPSSQLLLGDLDAGVVNPLFNLISAGQGWKAYTLLSWTGGGRITNVVAETTDTTPLNPPTTQAVEQI